MRKNDSQATCQWTTFPAKGNQWKTRAKMTTHLKCRYPIILKAQCFYIMPKLECVGSMIKEQYIGGLLLQTLKYIEYAFCENK